MLDLFEDYPITTVIITLLFVLLGFLLIDGIFTRPEYFNGNVVEKYYKPEVDSYGTGYGVTTGGKGAIISTSNHESEKFIIMVKNENGDVISTESNATLFYDKKNGDRVKCKNNRGLFTNSIWSTDCVE